MLITNKDAIFRVPHVRLRMRVSASHDLILVTICGVYGVVDDEICILVMRVCLSLAAFPHYCMDPGVTWGNGRRCPLVVHYWADLQLVHRFHCYDNTAPNAKCQQVLVLALCLVYFVMLFCVVRILDSQMCLCD